MKKNIMKIIKLLLILLLVCSFEQVSAETKLKDGIYTVEEGRIYM